MSTNAMFRVRSEEIKSVAELGQLTAVIGDACTITDGDDKGVYIFSESGWLRISKTGIDNITESEGTQDGD